MKIKKVMALLLVLVMVLSMAGCGDKDNASNNVSSQGEDNSDKPDTWIADRTIGIQVYVDDIGYSLPDDINNTPVMKELTKRTGIKLDVQYTPGDKDSSVLASQLASGTIPDVIVSYLNNSTRPEFALMLKAAKEDMFADISPYLKDSKVYSKYLEEGFLPHDTQKNIMFREEFEGATYIAHLAIPRVDRSLTFEPEEDFVGGLYIQKSIAEALNLDVTKIRTQDQFYDLLTQIKEGGFKDDNGNPVYPLGPKYWGGSKDSLEYIVNNYQWGYSDGYNITKEGEILHEVETDYVYEKINFVRKLLDEQLINPEFFTMDATRAEEVSKTHNSAIIADVHNYQDIIYKNADWMPLGPLDDFTGDNSKIKNGKSGYGAWAISAAAEKPEEIFEFLDYLSTKEGKLLCQYGVEGEHYNMVDGKPIVVDEVQAKIDEGDTKYLVNEIGAGFGSSGAVFFDFMLTDIDAVEDFGESRPGSGSSATFEGAIKVAEYNPPKYRLVEGLPATAYLLSDNMKEINAQMSLLDYKEVLVQAIFAKDDNEVKTIIESFKKQLNAAGLEEFKAHLTKIYSEDKSAIDFYTE